MDMIRMIFKWDKHKFIHIKGCLFAVTFVCCLFVHSRIEANPEERSLRFGGFEREYLIYTPQHPKSRTPSGILIGLHGFNGSMKNFFNEYDFRAIADAMNYLILAPQALPEQNEAVRLKATIINLFLGDKLQLDAVWACGLKVKANSFLGTLIDDELNRDVDDVGFIETMIRMTLEAYKSIIPPENIFMIGTSMGGYMAYQFARIQPVKLAGMVSVAGSMGLAIKGAEPGARPQTPICDFHSLTDEVVPYEGVLRQNGATIYLAQSKEEVIRFWTENNETGAPVVERVEYYPSDKSITVEKITYPGPVNEVIHYKIEGANHHYFFKKEEGDCMDHREEITKFISAHATGLPDHNGHLQKSQITVYPNPARDFIYPGIMEGSIRIYTLTGQAVWSGSFHSGSLSVSFLPPGTYILHIQTEGKTHTTKLIKQ